jgi:hypothetical protein
MWGVGYGMLAGEGDRRRDCAAHFGEGEKGKGILNV